MAGKLLNKQEALRDGLVDEVVPMEEVLPRAEKRMKKYLQANSDILFNTKAKLRKEWLDKFDWGDRLYEKGPIPTNRPRYKHERLKYRVVSFLEQNINGGKHFGGFKNYTLLKK